MEKKPEFGRLRGMLFPIHQSELKKFLPLTAIFLMISFNYTTLRSVKDIYLINYINADVLYYVKLFGVTPGVILFTILYSNISKVADRDTRFNIVIGYFLAFLAIFYFILIPNLEAIKLNFIADSLIHRFPTMTNLWEAVRFWPFSLFYIHGEAWGTMALGVLFWTFTNEITSVEQSKRAYSFLMLGAATGQIGSGAVLKAFKNDFSLTLQVSMGFMVTILAIYNYLAYEIKKNPSEYQVEQRPKKKKASLSFMESLKFLARSEYLSLIATLVISYGVVMSLFEAVWKAKLKEFSLGDNSLLTNIYANQAIFGGMLSIFLIFFLSGAIVKRGWRFAAAVTPTIALVATLLFFSVLYFQGYLESITASFGVSPLTFAVLVGLANVVFIKSAKYVLFDTTKERAYIPLDEESKIRGKAAVDGVGSRVGKSLGSLLITLVFVPFMGSIANAQYFIFFFILAALLLWLRAVNRLSVLFEKRVKEQEEEATKA